MTGTRLILLVVSVLLALGSLACEKSQPTDPPPDMPANGGDADNSPTKADGDAEAEVAEKLPQKPYTTEHWGVLTLPEAKLELLVPPDLALLDNTAGLQDFGPAVATRTVIFGRTNPDGRLDLIRVDLLIRDRLKDETAAGVSVDARKFFEVKDGFVLMLNQRTPWGDDGQQGLRIRQLMRFRENGKPVRAKQFTWMTDRHIVVLSFSAPLERYKQLSPYITRIADTLRPAKDANTTK